MKKILFAVTGLVIFGLTACNSTAEKAQKEEKSLAAKIENCTNTDSVKVYVEQAKTYAQKLIGEGKIDEAKKYIAEIQPVIEKKAPALASTLTSVSTMLEKVGDKAKCAADSARKAAQSAGDSVKAKATEAVNKKASEIGDAAREKAAEAADKAKEKVNGLFK